MSLRVELEKDLERRFRERAMMRFGYSKGSIKKATKMAIEKWMQSEHMKKPIKKFENPVDMIVGLLADVPHKNSVKEQHEIKKIWAKIAEDK